MKVTRVRWRAYRVPFRSPYVTSLGTVTQREGMIIELTSDSGLMGLGEAVLMPEVASSLNRLGNMAERMAPLLLHDDVSDELDFEVKGEAGAAMAAAVDCAMLDLMARSRGVSLARQLAGDGPVATEMQVNVLLSQADLPDLQEAAAASRAAGYTTAKLKAGMAPDLAGEVARVAAVREAVGPDVKLRIDPNGAWNVDQAIETIKALQAYDIDYVEQPVDTGNPDGLRRVQEAVETAIAADEDVTDLFDALRIVGTGAARVLVLKPSRLGGPRVVRDILQGTAGAGVRCVVTTSIETGIGAAACLHLASLVQGELAHGLSTLELLADDLIKAPGLPIERGVMRLPDGPGLGVELDEDALERFAVGGWRDV